MVVECITHKGTFYELVIGRSMCPQCNQQLLDDQYVAMQQIVERLGAKGGEKQMNVRGKFFVLSVAKSSPHSSGTMIKLGAVAASDKEKSENNHFHKYTPNGSVEMFVDNPPAEEFFVLGKTVYVDFSEAPAE